MTAENAPAVRRVRSFVLRAGRITVAQERALEELWPRLGLDLPSSGAIDLDRAFGRTARRVAEIGFGNGETLLALARAHPETDYLGIEVHPPGVGRVMLECARDGLANLRVVRHDAVEVLERGLSPGALDELLVLFPDPWHKKRHHKRRLIQCTFVELLASRLRPGGIVHLATDWEPYATQMLEVLGACAALENVAPGGGYVRRPSWRPATRFERRGERLGHGVWDLRFRRRE